MIGDATQCYSHQFFFKLTGRSLLLSTSLSSLLACILFFLEGEHYTVEELVVGGVIILSNTSEMPTEIRPCSTYYVALRLARDFVQLKPFSFAFQSLPHQSLVYLFPRTKALAYQSQNEGSFWDAFNREPIIPRCFQFRT